MPIIDAEQHPVIALPSGISGNVGQAVPAHPRGKRRRADRLSAADVLRGWLARAPHGAQQRRGARQGGSAVRRPRGLDHRCRADVQRRSSPEIQEIFPDQGPDRPHDHEFLGGQELQGSGDRLRAARSSAGLWTRSLRLLSVSICDREGYDVHVPTDACGDITVEAHERAVQRAIQAGVVPMTTLR